MGVGGSTAGNPGATGLDNADKRAGEHGEQGRDNARDRQSDRDRDRR